MKRKILLLAIFALALTLRLTKLADFPAGFTPDEAAQGYTAYSILKTGKDEWGIKFPLNPRFFGDFKPPLLTYLLIPSIAVLGLNEFAVRLPGAILGSLSVIVVYFLVKELFQGGFSRIDKRIDADLLPLLSAFFLAISPWHISMSRAAFEMNLTTFFLPLAVWLFLAGRRRPFFIILSFLAFGLNLISYHSAKLVTPLIVFFLIIWQRKTFLAGFRKNVLVYCLAAVVLAIFVGLTGFGFFKGAGTRVSDIGLFFGGWQAVADLRYFARQIGLPDVISRVFNNKLTFVWGEFIKSYLSYLSPQFLFTQGAGEATYGMIPGFGVLHLMEIFFVSAALYFLFKEKERGCVFLFFWVLVSPIPTALARGVGYHASRVAVMMPAIQIFSAYGFVKILGLVREKWHKLSKYFLLSCLPAEVLTKAGYLVILLSFSFFLEKYFFYAPLVNAPKMGYGWNQAASFLKNTRSEQIIVSRSLSEPQSYVMFYLKLPPQLVQKETTKWLRYQDESLRFVDQLGEYTLDNFVFRNFSFPEDWQKADTILVGSEKDYIVQEKMINELKSTGVIKKEEVINFPDSKIAFRIIFL